MQGWQTPKAPSSNCGWCAT